MFLRFFVTSVLLVSPKILAADLSAWTTGGFIDGTMVVTKDGLEPIENIMRWHSVTSYSQGGDDEKIIRETFQRTVGEVYTLNFYNGSSVTLAGDQVVWVPTDESIIDDAPGQWVKADELEKGTLLYSRLHGLLSIESIDKKDAEFYKVHNLELEDTHTFFVGKGAEIVVHNALLEKHGVVVKPSWVGKSFNGNKPWWVQKTQSEAQRIYEDAAKTVVKGVPPAVMKHLIAVITPMIQKASRDNIRKYGLRVDGLRVMNVREGAWSDPEKKKRYDEEMERKDIALAKACIMGAVGGAIKGSVKGWVGAVQEGIVGCVVGMTMQSMAESANYEQDKKEGKCTSEYK